jgi:hypothetical protein
VDKTKTILGTHGTGGRQMRLRRVMVSSSCLSGLKKKYKRTNNDLQNIHIKLKSNPTPLKQGVNSGASGA